ncbi:hypothetical protein Loa_00900 [Legionella oakridgensis ATCC 33761 = DSM 21215]|uniref:Smr domain protein n=2 Tax=Legionella oakridgensis TaxID=29423 RepID=W0BCW1_9GAMM|nr:hypothetical protein [Legionella oakridgensis]AHE66462.1 hypothetical protein Loa_00900 [Legionella oakridgensis ATCC 33761 = DSM 21215]ETO93808.1 hypothetical protein LOR_72c20800 [Legionella oakridgensis RV-2-2007]KTD43964.1 putative Smr domain protein [Legionella oakridgensis]STY19631.1 putative Smr domain protein [Legionella longbeachae]
MNRRKRSKQLEESSSLKKPRFNETWPDDSDQSGDSGQSEDTGGSSGSGGGYRRRGKERPDAGSTSYLVDETRVMERERRLQEQQGHRHLARVHAREHHDEEQQVAPEGELQNSIMQNPWLDNQRFDGVDPNLNPEPPLNTEARREYDNQRREQEMEKQLRLGNMPRFTNTPKPQGP